MRGLFRIIFLICLGAFVASCNTPDALTPKEEIPNEQAAKVRQQVPADETPVVASNTRVRMADEASEVRAPQNTLEAQRQALESGEENPSLTRPDDGSLSANLYKTRSDARPASNLYSNTPAAGTIRFLPIIGAPVQAVTPLSKELGNNARANGLVIKGSNDPTAQHVLKGYLSAFSDGKNVTVIYVWDVLDNSGARLHRIQGQESVPARGSDAWASVPDDLMREIGTSTIAEFMKWRQTQG